MNDRIPGSCYDNPIWYGEYRIYLSDMYNVHGFEYDYVHKDYDGEGDSRCGQAHTVEDAKLEISNRFDE